jgi:alkylation response protein AidB-like acyl-CoA dehydrogenase
MSLDPAELGVQLTESDRAFLAEWRSWLDKALPSAGPAPRAGTERLAWLRDWQARLDAGRWVAIGWPKEFGGRAASFVEQLLFHLESNDRNVPGPVGRIGIALCGPTLIHHGTPEQKQRFLPPLRAGREIWCQGFSEPDAGSDLASLRTKGVVDGDDLLITGQKVWTSGAHYADWMFALVRTDPDAPKHEGISFVLVPMDATGVSVRPIKQISGDHEFNEVFLDEVRVPLANVVGKLNDGWRVSRTTLSNERAVLFVSRQVAFNKVLRQIISIAQQPDGFGDGKRAAEDPATRQRIARAWIDAQLIRINGVRNLANVISGGVPGPEGSMSKLFGQEAEKSLHELAMDVAGPGGLIEHGSSEAVDKGKWVRAYLRTRASTIGGGTSEMQRNVLAERVLGQPRDLAVG